MYPVSHLAVRFGPEWSRTHPDTAWSSYRANAHGEASDLVTPHAHFLALRESDDARQLAYRRFVSQRPSRLELAAIRAAASSSTALGPAEFIATLPEEARRSRKPPGRPKRASPEPEIPLCGKPGTSRF